MKRKQLIEDFDRIFSLNLIQEQGNNKLNEERIKYIEGLINERAQARVNKEWDKSDKIREALLQEGIEITDTKEGTVWKLR